MTDPSSSWFARHPTLGAALAFGAGGLTIVILARIADPYTWRGRPIP